MTSEASTIAPLPETTSAPAPETTTLPASENTTAVTPLAPLPGTEPASSLPSTPAAPPSITEAIKAPAKPKPARAAAPAPAPVTQENVVETINRANIAAELSSRFDSPALSIEQQKRMADNREAVKRCADQLISSANGGSRELSLSLTHLEEVLFFANAAIARNG